MRPGKGWEEYGRERRKAGGEIESEEERGKQKEESEAEAALEEEDTCHVRPARPHTKALPLPLFFWTDREGRGRSTILGIIGACCPCPLPPGAGISCRRGTDVTPASTGDRTGGGTVDGASWEILPSLVLSTSNTHSRDW